MRSYAQLCEARVKKKYRCCCVPCPAKAGKAGGLAIEKQEVFLFDNKNEVTRTPTIDFGDQHTANYITLLNL